MPDDWKDAVTFEAWIEAKIRAKEFEIIKMLKPLLRPEQVAKMEAVWYRIRKEQEGRNDENG